MAQEIADSKLIDTWSSDGLKVKPDISKIIEGWQLGEQPPHEYMNWLQNTFGSKLNHILKNGVAGWSDTTPYLAGSSVQHNGNVWLCKATNTNSEPTDVSANWKRIITVESLNTVLSGYVTLTGNQTIPGVKTFSSSPIVPTPTSGAQAVNKDYADLKVAKVTSTDKSIVRFDGIGGDIQNSKVVIDDNGNMSAGGIIVSYNNFIASADYTDGNYIRMIRQGSLGLGVSLEVVVQNTKTVEILPNGSYLSKSYGAIGYGSGAGGIVTQLGSKSAEVALNKQTGIIITHNQTLTAGQSVTFPVYNAFFDSNSDIAYPIVVGSSNYRVESLILASDNKYHIKLTNVSASSLSDSVEIRFVIFKGARA